jgi:hypothetical protein
MARVRNIPILPLAKLGPFGLLTTVAAVSAVFILSTGDFAKAWSGVGLLPLVVVEILKAKAMSGRNISRLCGKQISWITIS